jgi:hypothetical protein
MDLTRENGKNEHSKQDVSFKRSLSIFEVEYHIGPLGSHVYFFCIPTSQIRTLAIRFLFLLFSLLLMYRFPYCLEKTNHEQTWKSRMEQLSLQCRPSR